MDSAGKDKVKLATAAALIANLIFGLSFMASRIALEHTSSAIMLSLRFATSVLAMLLLGISFLRRRSACRREEKKLREEIRLFREAKEQEATKDE